VSNVGHVRSTNEDCYFVGRFDRTLEPILTNIDVASEAGWHHRAGYAALVADGMGGHAAGELASRVAVTTFLGLALDTPDWIMRYDDPAMVAEVIERVESRLLKIDELLASVGRTRARLSGLGTTLTIMAVLPPDGLLAHVGDSRAYLHRAGRLSQLTRDHTTAQALADAGLIDPKELPTHPLRHVLTQALGHGEGRLGIEVQQVRFEPGDRVLLCTDGLTDSLDDDHIARLLEAAPSPAMACKSLLDAALERGGEDNVTIVVGRVG
jgi:protein phosphatase